MECPSDSIDRYPPHITSRVLRVNTRGTLLVYLSALLTFRSRPLIEVFCSSCSTNSPLLFKISTKVDTSKILMIPISRGYALNTAKCADNIARSHLGFLPCIHMNFHNFSAQLRALCFFEFWQRIGFRHKVLFGLMHHLFFRSFLQKNLL